VTRTKVVPYLALATAFAKWNAGPPNGYGLMTTYNGRGDSSAGNGWLDRTDWDVEQ